MADEKSPNERMQDWAEEAQDREARAGDLPEEAERPPTYGDLGHYAVRIVGGALLALLVLLGLVVLLLQTPWGARKAKNLIVEQLNPLFNDARIQVDSVSGNFITRLRLYDVEFFSTETGERMAYVDTASARYNLLKLFRRRVVIRELNLANPSVAMEQQSDGSWDLLKAFPADTTRPAHESVFALEIDEMSARDARLRAEFYQAGKDPVLRGDSLNLMFSELEQGDGLTIHVDTVWGTFKPPGVDYNTRLRASGALGDSLLHVGGLRLTSPHSNLYAAGTLRPPSARGDPYRDIDFRLQADPVAFRDLLPLAPRLNPTGRGTIELDATGTSRLLSIDGEAQFGDGSTVSIDGQATPFAEGDLSYQLQASLSRVNPGYFTAGGGQPALLNAQADVDLTGTDPQELNGTLNASLEDSRVGSQQIRRATLESTFTDGKADFDVEGALRGAQLTAEGTGRFFDDVPTYQATGRFSQVELGTLLSNPKLSSDLNGQFQVQGVDFNLKTANVEADVSLANSVLNGQQINEGTASLALKSGKLNYDARLDTPGGFLAFRGRGSFEGPRFRYWINEGSFRNVNLATFTGNAQQQTDLTGTFSAQGAGLDPQTMDLTGNLSLNSGSYGKYQIQQGQFDVNQQSGRTTFGGQLALQGGRFDVTGSGRFFHQPTPSYRLDGNFQQVDVGTLTQNPQQSSTLNGRLTLEGTGFDPQTARLTADLSLYDSILNDQQIDEGTANVSLRGGNLSYDVNFKSPGGAFLARGTGTFQNGIFRYQIDEGSFSNVNVALFTGNPDNTSKLSGTFSGEGQGTSLAEMTLDVRVNLSAGRFNRQDIRSGLFTVSLREGDFDVEGNVETPEGRFAFAGGGNLLGPSTSFALREGSFSGVNLGALLNNPDLQTSLNGTVDLAGRGADLASRTFEGTITLHPSTINQLQINEGTIRLDVREGRGTARAQVDFQSGALDVTARGSLTGTPTYQLAGTVHHLDLGALTGIDSLRTLHRLAFDVRGAGTNPRTMTLGGQVSADTLLFTNATLYDLHSTFQLKDGYLQVDTVTVHSSFADAHGGGHLALFDPSGTRSSEFFFRADLDDLAPLQPFVPAQTLALEEGFVEGRVYGPADRLHVEGNARLSSLAYNNLRVADFEGRFSGVLDSTRTPQIGTLRAEAGYFSLPTFTVENTKLRARFSGTSATFNMDMRVDRERNLTASGSLDLRPGHERVQIDSLAMRLGGARWALLQPATVSYANNQYRVSNLLVYSEDQQIALDGVVDPDGEQNLVLTVEQFQIGTVADLLNFQGLSGTMSGYVNLTGPATAPEADGTLNLDLESYGETAGDLRLQLGYADQRLNVDALLTNQGTGTMNVKGYVPVDLSIAPGQANQGVQVTSGQTAATEEVALTLQADSFAVDWIRPFLQPGTVENLDGRIEADVEIGGTFGTPQLNGTASFMDGRLELPKLGVAYRDITAETQLADNRMTVERFVVKTGDGKLTGDGTINLADLTLGEFDLEGKMDEFRAIDTREYNATLDGHLTLRGTTQQPILRGGVDVLSADVYLGESTSGGASLEKVQLSDADVRQLESTFGLRLSERDTSSFDFYQALDMQLDVELQRDTWLRQRINPEISIQLTGNLDAQKEPYADLRLFGTIDVVEQRSYVEVAARRFNITEGVLRFNGEPTNPRLDVQAEYAARAPTSTRQTAANITLSLTGPLQNLEPTLGSGEGLSRQDIASLLGTGQQAGENVAVQAGGELLLGQVTSLVEGAAGQEFGLDVFEINPLGPRGELTPTLTAGKYLTRRFYAGIYQPLSPPNSSDSQGQIGTGTQITLEYQFLQWLLARASQTNNGLRFDLFWEYSY